MQYTCKSLSQPFPLCLHSFPLFISIYLFSALSSLPYLFPSSVYLRIQMCARSPSRRPRALLVNTVCSTKASRETCHSFFFFFYSSSLLLPLFHFSCSIYFSFLLSNISLSLSHWSRSFSTLQKEATTSQSLRTVALEGLRWLWYIHTRGHRWTPYVLPSILLPNLPRLTRHIRIATLCKSVQTRERGTTHRASQITSLSLHPDLSPGRRRGPYAFAVVIAELVYSGMMVW